MGVDYWQREEPRILSYESHLDPAQGWSTRPGLYLMMSDAVHQRVLIQTRETDKEFHRQVNASPIITVRVIARSDGRVLVMIDKVAWTQQTAAGFKQRDWRYRIKRRDSNGPRPFVLKISNASGCMEGPQDRSYNHDGDLTT